MPGPTHSQTATNNRTNPHGGQPPRPANAWILYRSDKMKEIPSPAPGEPRRPQAEISRMISEMWKHETPEVRGHYERLSEIKKAEHREKYPDYRFQPMKREDKERLRAEKQAEKAKERKAKGRARRSNSQPSPPLFTTDARLPTGASTSGTRVPSTQLDPIPEAGPSSQPASHSSTMPSTPFDQSATSVAHAPDPFSPSVEPFSTASLFASAWSSIELQPLTANPLDIADSWDRDTSQLQKFLALPPPPPPSVLGWGPDGLDFSSLFTQVDYQQPLQTVLSATDNPDMFNFDNLDADFTELFDGTRDLEVNMHKVNNRSASANYDQFGNFGFLFGDCGASNSLYTLSTTNGAAEELSTLDEGMSYDALSMSPSSGHGMEFRSFDSFLQDAPSLADGTEEDVVTPERPGAATPSPQDDVSQMTHPVPAPYMPPPGAANASTRRVAADWRHVRAPSPEPQPPQAAATTWWL